MTEIKKYFIHILPAVVVFSVLLIPSVSLAAGLVACDGTTANPCGFPQLLSLVNTVIKFVLFKMVVPIAAIMFAYAGFLLVTSGGSTENRGKAKNIFTSAVIGLIFAVAAFLIVRTVLTILGYDGDWIGF